MKVSTVKQQYILCKDFQNTACLQWPELKNGLKLKDQVKSKHPKVHSGVAVQTAEGGRIQKTVPSNKLWTMIAGRLICWRAKMIWHMGCYIWEYKFWTGGEWNWETELRQEVRQTNISEGTK